LGVTVSIGVAVAPRGTAHVEELIRRADAALYEAKRAGRNRVQAADLPDSLLTG
jgi:diguanylate cyclase (GGDEF)-like protein